MCHSTGTLAQGDRRGGGCGYDLPVRGAKPRRRAKEPARPRRQLREGSAGPDQPDDLDLGIAGASARREHERRRASREKRVRDKHPRIGGALLALSDDPSHEAAWARGAGGEEHVAKLLAKYLSDGVLVLHDRRIPGSRANIDHIAVAPSGVWVIDSKRYKGKVTV